MQSLKFFQAFEDIHLPQRETLKDVLQYSNYFFAVVFGLEFLLKLIGYGVVGYFTSFWNLLDVFIVAVSVDKIYFTCGCEFTESS